MASPPPCPSPDPTDVQWIRRGVHRDVIFGPRPSRRVRVSPLATNPVKCRPSLRYLGEVSAEVDLRLRRSHGS